MRLPGGIHIDRLLIFLIIVIGAVLRFYDYGSIPFTHDEFSAVFRTQFSSFHDLISKGVVTDTHPAGVQIFLYYWIKLTGISEPLVKLPFTLFSLVSVLLVYVIGRKWFTATAGLVAASFLSFLQYPLMYGQIARPYASGLFLVLLMVYFWTNLILDPRRRFYLNLAGYVLASVLCAYDHHFALLFCGITGLTGIFIIHKSKRIPYALSWVVIFLLYVPHLPIFFGQLKQGGIGGWLSKPRPDFVLDYLSYAFQFSPYVLALLGILIVLSLVWRVRGKKPDIRFIIVSFVWFVVPLLTGYIYSVYVNPVLQYSVLLFSFPFLLLLMFFYADAGKAWQKFTLVALCALVIIPSLIIERQHYRLFYRSPYKEILSESKHAADYLGRSNCCILIDSHRRFSDYYLAKPEMKGFSVNWIHDIFEPPILGSILDTCSARYFVYGCISNSAWEDYPIILSKFPCLLEHKRFNEGDFYVFARDTVRSPDEYYFTADADFTVTKTGWINDWTANIWYTAGDLKNPVYRMDSSVIFSPTFRGPLRDICKHTNDIVDFYADVETAEPFSEAYLQLGIYQKETLLSFQSKTIRSSNTEGFQRIYCSYRLADIDWRHHFLSIQGFIWNPLKQEFLIRKMSFRIRHGNPFLYGLCRKI